MTSPRLLLASSSPRRRELLVQLSLPFTVVRADVDETPQPGEAPAHLAERLAREKARAVAERVGPAAPDTLVVGADTVVACGRQTLSKPVSPEEAVTMLESLRGRWHRVISGVAVVAPSTGALRSGTETTRVRLRPMTDAEIQAYVATGDPLDKAGGYAIQNRIFRPVASIRGCATNVVGLPLCRLGQVLTELGVDLPPEWRKAGPRCHCADTYRLDGIQ